MDNITTSTANSCEFADKIKALKAEGIEFLLSPEQSRIYRICQGLPPLVEPWDGNFGGIPAWHLYGGGTIAFFFITACMYGLEMWLRNRGLSIPQLIRKPSSSFSTIYRNNNDNHNQRRIESNNRKNNYIEAKYSFLPATTEDNNDHKNGQRNHRQNPV